MVLNNSFSNVTGDQRHGYRTRTVLWYRKHFRLPADWDPAGGSNSLVFLRFDGVVHVAQLWLNGVFLASATHTSSYGAFTGEVGSRMFSTISRLY